MRIIKRGCIVKTDSRDYFILYIHQKATAEALRREGCMKEAKGREDQDTIRLPFQSGLEFTVNEQLIT